MLPCCLKGHVSEPSFSNKCDKNKFIRWIYLLENIDVKPSVISLIVTPPIKRLICYILVPVEYCRHKLGMEDGSIPDDRITASSQRDYRFPPSNARLNLDRFWSPLAEPSWLQVDMGANPVQIEGVITQGRPDYAQYVTHYQVQYSIEITTWMYVNKASTPQVRVLSK